MVSTISSATPNRALFARCADTFLDRWPAALEALAVAPTRWLYPSLAELAFIRTGPVCKGPVRAMADEVAAPLIDRLQGAIDGVGRTAFVRTQVRSPKDSRLFVRNAGRVTTAWSAIAMLRESARFHQDCAWLQMHGAMPAIAVRPWLEIDPWAEFRCFFWQRELVGMTQLRRQALVPEPMRSHPVFLEHFLREFGARLGLALPCDNVVADVVIPRWSSAASQTPTAGLLELNPWHALTDPGWFDWRARGSFDGSLRLS